MTLDENPSYYELLEVAPDASPQELRAAYLRAKAAFKKDSIALYTLISESETEALLAKIEEAYQVLSNPERRRAYDRNHGLLSVEELLLEQPLHPVRNQKIISIDRVPPMEADHSDDILVPPSTDFSATSGRHHDDLSGIFSSNSKNAIPSTPAPTPFAPINSTPPLQAPIGPRHSMDPRANAELAEEIQHETEWRGHFLKRIREAKKISLEELSEFTKISRTYLLAIEDENYARLPAPVYLRGFIIQMAKYLKLPDERVATAYLVRYNQKRNQKD